MKTVMQLMDIVSVPDDYERCSVCGKWASVESFNNDDTKRRTRTNCVNCFLMPYDDMKALKEETQNLYNSPVYKEKSRRFAKESELRASGITKDVLVSRVESYLCKIKELPDDALFVDYYRGEEESYFGTPGFDCYKLVDGDYPPGYPKALDGKLIYFKSNQ